MALKKIVQQRRNQSNTDWDILHAETSADVVLYDDTQTQLNAANIQEAIAALNSLVGTGGANVLIASSPPQEADIGDLWFDTTNASLYLYYDDGTTVSWIEVGGMNGVTGITVSSSPPATANPGELWWNSSTGVLYIYYDDGESVQWVDVTYGSGEVGGRVVVSPTAPVSPVEGDLWFDSNEEVLYLYYDDGTGLDWFALTSVQVLDADNVNYDNSVSNLTATDVQEAIDEVVTLVENLEADGIVYDNTDSDLVATDVQGAIDELVDIKMDVDGLNSDVEKLKFQNIADAGTLEVGQVVLEGNLPKWQISGNTKHLVGQQLITRARNRTGAQRAPGDPVFISGVFTPAPQGPGTPIKEYELADRNVDIAVFAVASCPAPDNEDGCIITKGIVENWDTSAFTAGDDLYLTDTPGQYTTTKPTSGPVFFVGKVLRAAEEGIVFINPTLEPSANFTTTIATTDVWTDETGYYTLEKTVAGITAEDSPIADVNLANATVSNVADIQAAWASIYRITTSEDMVTFYALDEPVFPENTVVDFQVVK